MRKWKGLAKTAEECGELVQELMKLLAYPSGKHPRRRKSLILSTQDEAADVLGALGYFLEKNNFDMAAIEKRRAMKFRRWVKRYGETPAMVKMKKKNKKKASKRDAKKSPQVKISGIDVSSHVETAQST